MDTNGKIILVTGATGNQGGATAVICSPTAGGFVRWSGTKPPRRPSSWRLPASSSSAVT